MITQEQAREWCDDSERAAERGVALFNNERLAFDIIRSLLAELESVTRDAEEMAEEVLKEHQVYDKCMDISDDECFDRLCSECRHLQHCTCAACEVARKYTNKGETK